MNKRNTRIIMVALAVIAVGLVTVLGGPINPDGGVFLPFIR